MKCKKCGCQDIQQNIKFPIKGMVVTYSCKACGSIVKEKNETRD